MRFVLLTRVSFSPPPTPDLCLKFTPASDSICDGAPAPRARVFAVSLPAPAYYAHLAAYRAKCYLPHGAGAAADSSGSGKKQGIPQVIAAPSVHASVRHRLYYC